jgi:hypothetical protein
LPDIINLETLGPRLLGYVARRVDVISVYVQILPIQVAALSKAWSASARLLGLRVRFHQNMDVCIL